MCYLIRKVDDKRMATMGIGTIERYLKDVNYPADKNEIVNNARRQNAPEDIARNLDMLPNQRFNSPEDVRRNMQEGSSRSGMSSSSGMGSTRESSSGTGSSYSKQSRY